MTANEIIDAYVADVMRHVPRSARDDIGLELHGLLGEMLEARLAEAGPGDQADVALVLLRDFGSPEEVATRYNEPTFLIIPASQTRQFAMIALAGVLIQWLLSLPRAWQGETLARWWFDQGLGSLWWPGFMVLMAFTASWLRHKGYYATSWKPHLDDGHTVHRKTFACGLAAFAIGAITVGSLPLLVPALPQPQAGFFAFDEQFLTVRAPLAAVLWFGQFALFHAVYSVGRWAKATLKLALMCDLLWLGLMAWWIFGGPIFAFAETDAVVKSILGFVCLAVILSLAANAYRQQSRPVVPVAVG